MTARASRPPSVSLPQVGGWLRLIGLAGVGLGVSGLAMILLAPVTGLRWYGFLLAAIGVVQLAELTRRLSLAGRTVRLILALVYVGAGLLIAISPPMVSRLALLVAVLFAAAGAFRAAWAFAWPGRSKPWGLAAGVCGVVLGGLMLAGWPAAALWLLGVAAAVDLTVYGLSAVALGWALRRYGGEGGSSRR